MELHFLFDVHTFFVRVLVEKNNKPDIVRWLWSYYKFNISEINSNKKLKPKKSRYDIGNYLSARCFGWVFLYFHIIWVSLVLTSLLK